MFIRAVPVNTLANYFMSVGYTDQERAQKKLKTRICWGQTEGSFKPNLKEERIGVMKRVCGDRGKQEGRLEHTIGPGSKKGAG